MKEFTSFFSVRREDYNKIKEHVWAKNWHGLHLISAIAVIALATMSVAGLFLPGYQKNLAAYIIYSLVSLLFWGASYGKIKSTSVKAGLVYTFFAVFLSYGIVMGTIISPKELTVSFIVMMLVVPLLFTARACVMNGIVFCSIILYVIAAYFTQEDLVFTYNMLNVIPYGILSMFVTAVVMRSKMQRLLYAAEIDTLEQVKKKSQAKIANYENFITDMMRYASSEEEPDKIIDQLVKYIGEKLGSDRAYIFEENSRGGFDNTYEWCKEGVSQEKDNLQNVPYEGVIEVWYRQYQKSKNIIIYDLEEYRSTSQALYDLLKPQGIHTLVTGPIIIKGKMVGFYGVDNPPKALLNEISDLIGVAEFIVSFMIRIRDNADELAYGALHDQLTGCKNRKAMDWLYTKDFDTEQSIAVVMCDMNGLKAVNDMQGHDAGDRFILRTVEILNSVFGKEQVYRLGGDEFAAVLTGITNIELEEKLKLARIQLGTTASIGISFRETMDTDFDSILKIADREMYRQKHDFYVSSGKDRRKQNR